MPVSVYGFVFLSSAVCGALGVLFYKLVFFLRGSFKKIRPPKPWSGEFVRILIAVLLGGALSLATVNVMGGGHGLIESLGTFGGTAEETTESVFGLPLVWTLLLVCALKFLITGVNMGAGVPCGAFIPMLAIGACIGALLNRAWLSLGMDAAHADLMVMICMAAFFTTIVKAPITGIVMVCELTWSFAPLLPVVIGVSVGYIIGDVSRTESIYEKMLDLFEEETGVKERARREIFSVAVQPRCIADGRAVRDVLWPSGAVVTEIGRGTEKILPDGDTELRAGDTLTVVCRTDSPEKTREDLQHITGN